MNVELYACCQSANAGADGRHNGNCQRRPYGINRVLHTLRHLGQRGRRRSFQTDVCFRLALPIFHPLALREELLLVAEQALAGLGVVLVEVIHELLDVLVLPMFRHQFGEYGVCLVFGEELGYTAQENLHRSMSAAFAEEVARLQLFLLHHALSNEANAVINFSRLGIVLFNFQTACGLNFPFNFPFNSLFKSLFNSLDLFYFEEGV